MSRYLTDAKQYSFPENKTAFSSGGNCYLMQRAALIPEPPITKLK